MWRKRKALICLCVLSTFHVLPEVIRDMGMIHFVNESRLKTPTVHFTDLYTCHRRVLS